MTEAANSLSTAAGPELSIARNPIANLQSSFELGHGRTRLGSDLRALAPRCLSRENTGRTMTVLHHALCGDDFGQTPVSIIIGEKMSKVFFRCCGRCRRVVSKIKSVGTRSLSPTLYRLITHKFNVTQGLSLRCV